MAIWGLPFLAVSVYSLLNVDQLCEAYWLIVLLIAIGALGLFLVYTAVVSDDATVEKRTEFVSEGGDLAGVVLVIAVVVIAIPVWALLKRVRSGR